MHRLRAPAAGHDGGGVAEGGRAVALHRGLEWPRAGAAGGRSARDVAVERPWAAGGGGRRLDAGVHGERLGDGLCAADGLGVATGIAGELLVVLRLLGEAGGGLLVVAFAVVVGLHRGFAASQERDQEAMVESGENSASEGGRGAGGRGGVRGEGGRERRGEGGGRLECSLDFASTTGACEPLQ